MLFTIASSLAVVASVSAGPVLRGLPTPSKFGDDPSGSWLSYAVWADPQDRTITMLNTTWTVPSDPKSKFGSNAPGWWFGIQTAAGDGALIQPILAYGYRGNVYSIFNGVFDWTDGSWHTSSETYTVQPGDLITSSVYQSGPKEFTMVISSGGKSITTPYSLLAGQGDKTESTAYFVLEHQPDRCAAYPTNGKCTFSNIYVEVENKPVTPTWTVMQERPACNSRAFSDSPTEITFTWDAAATEHGTARKW